MMKKNCALIVVVVVVMVLSVAVFAAPETVSDGSFAATEVENIDVSGDITGDGAVNISDVQALLKHVNGQSIIAAGYNTDVNGDGVVNISDVQLLLKYINGQNVAIYGNSTGNGTSKGALDDADITADSDTANLAENIINGLSSIAINVSADQAVTGPSDPMISTEGTDTDSTDPLGKSDSGASGSSGSTVKTEISEHEHQWAVEIVDNWESIDVITGYEEVVDQAEFDATWREGECQTCGYTRWYSNDDYLVLTTNNATCENCGANSRVATNGIVITQVATVHYPAIMHLEPIYTTVRINTPSVATVCSICGEPWESNTDHTHIWVDLTTTTGFYEEQVVGYDTVTDEKAWTEKVTIWYCRKCGYETTDELDITNHITTDNGGYTYRYEYIDHEAVTHEEPIYGRIWVEASQTDTVCGICGTPE